MVLVASNRAPGTRYSDQPSTTDPAHRAGNKAASLVSSSIAELHLYTREIVREVTNQKCSGGEKGRENWRSNRWTRRRKIKYIVFAVFAVRYAASSSYYSSCEWQ